MVFLFIFISFIFIFSLFSFLLSSFPPPLPLRNRMRQLSPPVVALQNNPTSLVCRSGVPILGRTGF